jgi:methyl-accepting chemotaxis protein
MFLKNSNNKVLDSLDNILDFLNNDTNSIIKIDFDCTGFNKKLKEKLDLICEVLNRKNDDELLIYGELMLVAEKMMEGNFTDKIYHVNTSNSKLNYIAKTINSLNYSLKNNISQIENILNEYNKHNYVNQLNSENVENDFRVLFNGVNSLQKTITNMLVENKENGITLNKSSNSLLENVNKLNISSNDAAAKLEETAGAVEEISSNIKNNTENISKMARLSLEVQESAFKGENLANETTNAMEEINQQVNSISEAISIIDQIAFQTNILSLNAAVEAATAGEAGRGFAVVAQEVRNLANRSADAAKEIKKLVENATNKANYGKEIANDMINGYMQLNSNITNTSNIIEDIQSASNEQLLGIKQINDAINQLDEQTQQNAIVASQTYDIAILTDNISKIVIINANSKDFVGKDYIQNKEINEE